VLLTMIFYYSPFFRNYQVIVLILSSFVFYGYSNPYLIILLFVSASLNAIFSYFIYFSSQKRSKVIWTTFGVIANILILTFFKYSSLIILSLRDYISIGGLDNSFLVKILLPIGISFYTFQGISLVVDTFRHFNSKALPNFHIDKDFKNHYINTILYISFFPRLISGPIIKANDYLPQINRKFFHDINWNLTLKNLILGYFLKMVIADHLRDQTYWISFPYYQSFSSLSLLTMLFGYSMQIFADFAGYSLIAIGIANLFGYKLPQNFNFPYISKSFSEFWTRWHISLSNWLREYLYFSLGGKRKGNFRTYLNLIIVMFIGGLWHGAAWSFAVWGLWHGVALAIERPFRDKIKNINNRVLDSLKIFIVFTFVTFAWLLFKLTNFSQALDFIRYVYTNIHTINNYPIILSVLFYSFPVIAYHVYYLIKNKLNSKFTMYFEAIVYGIMIFMLLVSSGSPGAFIYFQF
jgi:alginate O-acetyltransferase complex protein AlgI